MSWQQVGVLASWSCDESASANANADELVVVRVAQNLDVANPLHQHQPPCGTCSVALLDASCDDAATFLYIEKTDNRIDVKKKI